MSLPRFFPLWCLLWCLLPSAAASASPRDAWHAERAERLLLPATAGDFDAPAKTVEMPSGDWQAATLPDVNMPRTPGAADNGRVRTAWYRLALPADLRETAQPLYFYLPRWQTVGQVALYGADAAGQGRLLWRSEGDTVWNGFNRPVWVSLDPPGQQARPHTLLLRMDSVPGLGGGVSSAWVGTEDALSWRWRGRMAVQVWLPLLIGACFFVLGVFAFAVWCRRRSESLYLLFAVTALSFVLRYLHMVTPLDPRLMPSAWFGWMTVWAMDWLSVAAVMFGFRLCDRRFPRFEALMFVCLALHGILTLPPLLSSNAIAALSVFAYAATMLLILPATFMILRAARQRRSGTGLMLGLAIVLSWPLAVHDLLLAGYRLDLESFYLLKLTHVCVFLLFAFVLFRRYIDGIESLEHSHDLLAQRLRERETELADSYAKLREVEQRELLSRERQRLMRDMHDGLGGSLSGMLRIVDRGGYEAEGMKQALRECMDELRLTIDSLEPVEADVSVLLASLRFRLQPRLEAAGIRLVWRVEALPLLPWLTPSHAMHVMRIVQEVVTNVVKHAEAREMVFSTQADAAGACIRIEDDGKGFAGEAGATGGHGLRNIRYRAALLGASVRWQARATADGGPAGTCFTFLLPLAAPAATVADPH